MMKLFLLAALIVTAAQAASLGSDQCTWGPSFWCSSLGAASQCQAFTHCLRDYWTKLTDLQLTQECKVAQKLVKTVRLVKSSENGKNEAIRLVASMCLYVKDDVTRTKCKETVTKFLPDIFTLIDSDLEAGSVASVLGLCQSMDERVNHTPKQGPYYPPTNKTICDDCTGFITDLRTYINQPNAEDEFEKVMSNIICTDLGDLVDICKVLVGAGLPKLFKFIAENDNAEMVCRLSTLCTDTVESKPKWHYYFNMLKTFMQEAFAQVEVKADLMCHECQKVLEPAVSFKKDSLFRNNIEHAVGYLCSHTKLGEDKCLELAEGLIPRQLMQLVSEDFNVPEFCSKSLRCVADPEHQINAALMVTAPSAETNDCNDCLRFFADIRDVLHDSVSAPEAAALAKENICQKVGDYEFQCNTLMDVGMPFILDWLAKVDTPSRVCGDLTLCPKVTHPSKYDIVKVFNAAWNEGSLGDFKCDECTTLVEDAREADRNPHIQEGIINFFNRICDDLGKEANECKSLVQQYSPQLFELLASELEPSVICEILFKCTKTPVTNNLHSQHETLVALPRPIVGRQKKKTRGNASQQKGLERRAGESVEKKVGEPLERRVGESLECSACRLAVEKADQELAENATEQAIERDLKDLCDMAPAEDRESCQQFIVSITPSLIDMLIQQMDPRLICDEVKACNDTELHTPPRVSAAEALKQQKAVRQNTERRDPQPTYKCELCELVLGVVDMLIGENKTEAAIQSALDDVCNVLPAAIRDQCLSFVNEYSSVVVQLLQQELDPTQVCIYLDLCHNISSAVDSGRHELTGPAECTLCDLVMGEVDIMIGENKSEAAIERALEKVCELFPATISGECQDFIATYGPAVINLLIQEIPPKEVCKKLGFCPSRSAPLVVSEEPEVKAGPLCFICRLVMDEMDTILGENRTKEAIESALDTVCSLLPSNASAECVSFIDLYTPAIINLLLQEMDPQLICTELDLCAAANPVPAVEARTEEAAEEGNVHGVLECDVCKLVITEINKLIGENRSEAAIIHAVEVVCDVVSGDLRLQCQSEVQNYGPAVLDLLRHVDDPGTVCRAASLCSASHQKEKLAGLPGGVAGQQICLLCESLANYAKEGLEDGATQDQAIKLLQDVCKVLPQQLVQDCDTVVQQFTPEVMMSLAEKDHPELICKDIDLCPKDGEAEVTVDQ